MAKKSKAAKPPKGTRITTVDKSKEVGGLAPTRLVGKGVSAK